MNRQLREGKLDAPYKGWLSSYSGAIFTGQVVSVKKVKVERFGATWPRYKVKLQVDRYWQGVDSSETVIFTGVGGGDCGIRFRKGESWIVFAEMSENRLETGGCSFTAESRYVANIIKALELGAGKQPAKRLKPL